MNFKSKVDWKLIKSVQSENRFQHTKLVACRMRIRRAAFRTLERFVFARFSVVCLFFLLLTVYTSVFSNPLSHTQVLYGASAQYCLMIIVYTLYHPNHIDSNNANSYPFVWYPAILDACCVSIKHYAKTTLHTHTHTHHYIGCILEPRPENRICFCILFEELFLVSLCVCFHLFSFFLLL